MYIHGNTGSPGPAYTRATLCDVSDNHTPLRPVRVEGDLWELFGRVVGARKRSAIVREFIGWYLRRPGAELPSRPSVKQVAEAEREKPATD